MIEKAHSNDQGGRQKSPTTDSTTIGGAASFCTKYREFANFVPCNKEEKKK